MSHYAVVIPDLGFYYNNIRPGGHQNFSRCVTRALVSYPFITKLTIFTQVDSPNSILNIKHMLSIYAHAQIDVEVRAFAGERWSLTQSLIRDIWGRKYDHVMYLLINQSLLALQPFHPPYSVWLIGWESYKRHNLLMRHVLRSAHPLLSISKATADLTQRYNPEIPNADVVHLCLEPPLYKEEQSLEATYNPSNRIPAVLIVGTMFPSPYLYKGQRELILAWTDVIKIVPNAELWIVGKGEGRIELEDLVNVLPRAVKRQIRFLGVLNAEQLQKCYETCRVFALPSTREGFGLVFVEAALYGIPCIGGKYTSIPEVVLQEETGLLVEQDVTQIASACIRLLTDDVLAKRLGDAGRQRYLNYFRFTHFRERLLSFLEL